MFLGVDVAILYLAFLGLPLVDHTSCFRRIWSSLELARAAQPLQQLPDGRLGGGRRHGQLGEGLEVLQLAPVHRTLPRLVGRRLEEEELGPPPLVVILAHGDGGHPPGAGEQARWSLAGLQVVPPVLICADGEEVVEHGQRGLHPGVRAALHEGGHVAPRVGHELARREAVVPEQGGVEAVQRETQAGVERVGVHTHGVAGRELEEGRLVACKVDLVRLGDAAGFAQTSDRPSVGQRRRDPPEGSSSHGRKPKALIFHEIGGDRSDVPLLRNSKP